MKLPKILIVCLLAINIYAQPKQLHIVYISHFHSQQVFGKSVHSFASSVAKDLNIDLKISMKNHKLNNNLNRFEYLQFIREELSVKPKPDFALVILFKGISQQILELSQRYKVPVMIVNTTIPREDRTLISQPREKYKTFIGMVTANEQKAGYDIAQHLINEKRKATPTKKLHIVAISGPRESPEANERINGLKLAVKDDNNSVIMQIVHANWNEGLANFQANEMLKRYKDLDIIWCASDRMSLGAVQAMQDHNVSHKIVTAGIDWTIRGINAVRDNTMDATAGGHFMNGGIALILLYDYYFGKDFKEELGTKIQMSMQLLTKYNVSKYLNKFPETDWDDVDFRQFSKVLNKDMKKYDFSLNNLFNHIKR